MNKKIFICAVFLGQCLSTTSFAAVDVDAPIVQLRTSCTVNSVGLDNCFTTMPDLMNWISGTRQPTAGTPLKVDIGPGTFGPFSGYNGCHVTLSGSGRQHTVIDRDLSAYAITIQPNCVLDVEHLTIRSMGGLGAINLGNTSGGGGVTTWSDVEVVSTAYGWTESGCSDSKHYWFNSRIETHTGFAITRGYSACSETWFLGSEITAIANSDEGYTGEVFALGMAGDEAHVYGSVIRAIAGTGVVLPQAALGSSGKTVKGLLAVSAGPNANIHIHGTGIDVLSEEANNIAALGIHPNGSIHANEAAYNMSTGTSGSITRIINQGGTASAPYLWQQGTQPPVVGTITGGDMAVEIDCAATGCQSSGTETHLLISNNNCTGSGGPWFDVVTGSCR